MIRVRVFLCSWVLWMLVAVNAYGQGIFGTIRGTVEDPQRAVVPGATVTLTNQETGDVRSQISSDAGLFEFRNLPVSAYTLAVELPGFKKYVRENIAVGANQVIDLGARLELGEVTEIVYVVGTGEEIVTTTTPQLEGARFNERQVVELPNPQLDGDPNNLAVLAPGTTTHPGGVAGTGGSIGGNRPRNNNFVVDGVDNNDPSVTGPLAPVIQEAVEEFTLLTNQFSAEYGHSTAGQFISTTKSGTNEFHGRGWWYNQNRHTNSLDNITRATTPPGGDKPRYDYNRFGGQFGGPVMKDKWFFFGSYEYRNQTLAGSPSGIILVPTAAGLTTLKNLAANPATGVSSANVGILADLVPVAGAATTTKTVLNEATGARVPIELGQFSATTPNFDRTHLFLVSSDYQTSRHRIAGRFHYSRNVEIEPGELPVVQFNSDTSFNTRRFTFSDVFTISPTFINELRIGFNRAADNNPVDLPKAPGATDVFANYGIDDQNLFIGPQSNFPQSGADNIYNITDNMSWTTGAHSLRFGGEFRDIISKADFLPRARGEFTYQDLDEFVRDRFPSVVAIRGVGLSAFSQNRAGFQAFFQDTWKVRPRWTFEFGLRYEYWQVARDSDLQNLNGISNLLSVRNEVYTPEILAFLGLDADSPLLGTKIFDSLPARHQEALLRHVGESVIFRKPKADRNNFAPRLGLAWDVMGDGRTSVRAGLAVAHDVVFGNLPLLSLPPQLQGENRETNACVLNPRPAWCSAVSAGSSPLDADIRFSKLGFLEGGGLLPILPPDALIDRFTARALTGSFVVDDVAPETYTWSLSVQREMFTDYVFEARYLGNHAVHLPIQRWLSAGIPNPFRLPTFFTEADALNKNFSGAPTLAQFSANRGLLLEPYGFGGVLTKFTPDGQSWYHGGSAIVRKRFSQGLAFDANYTWSKTIDLVENELFTSFLNPRRPFEHLDIFKGKGLSGLHREHKFAISWLWEIPTPNFDSSLARKILGGWQFNGSYLAESGQPITVISRRDLNGDFDTAGDPAIFNPAGREATGTDVNFVCWNGTRASIAASAANCGGSARVVGYVAQNPNAQYVRGGVGALTNLGRNTFESPGINVWNISFMKKTEVGGEGRYVEFRVELWNAFNHPNFTIGNGTVNPDPLHTNARNLPGYATPGTSQFLDKTIFSGGLGNSPFQRIIQWGLKYIF